MKRKLARHVRERKLRFVHQWPGNQTSKLHGKNSNAEDASKSKDARRWGWGCGANSSKADGVGRGRRGGVKAHHSQQLNPKLKSYWLRHRQPTCSRLAGVLWSEYSCHVAESKQIEQSVQRGQWCTKTLTAARSHMQRKLASPPTTSVVPSFARRTERM